MKYKITFICVLLLFFSFLFTSINTVNSDEKKYNGMTISCQTWGYEWATPQMENALVELKQMGVNSFAIHPYARILNNGRIKFNESLNQTHISTPLKWAKELNLNVMIKPHLAYWGSNFSWRGEINFSKEEDWERFFQDYEKWINIQAKIAELKVADLFCIGTEYKNTTSHFNRWKNIILSVRNIFSGKITYAANWDNYKNISFWDELDLIGIQAYFPLTDKINPSEDDILSGWQVIINELNNFSRQHNKKILFTELGYNQSEFAAKKPWSTHFLNPIIGKITQKRCLGAALTNIKTNPFIVGVFLWKWFPEINTYHWQSNFNLQSAENKKLISKYWSGKSYE